eukprot:GHVR01054050.1.p1 GENE.GHVR01054050.1~~GHVR01054050.1.p1  ORF type:complete len:199 (+),score=53.97 GHVR01054050.1:220-816(+)
MMLLQEDDELDQMLSLLASQWTSRVELLKDQHEVELYRRTVSCEGLEVRVVTLQDQLATTTANIRDMEREYKHAQLQMNELKKHQDELLNEQALSFQSQIYRLQEKLERLESVCVSLTEERNRETALRVSLEKERIQEKKTHHDNIISLQRKIDTINNELKFNELLYIYIYFIYYFIYIIILYLLFYMYYYFIFIILY